MVGTGFTLIGHGVDPREGLSAQHLELLDALEVRCVTILESADHPSTFQAAAQSRRLVAVDTAPGDYFGSAGVMALPVRPDFYLFGAATRSADILRLIGQLAHDLRLSTGTGTAR